MADKEPQIVLDTILEIPETDNHRIHADYIDAALKMPPNLASKWVKSEEKWLRKQNWLFDILPIKYGPLISHLASGGEQSTVIMLCSSLLRFNPNPELPRETEFQGHKMTFPKEPIPLVSSYYFNEILTNNIPDVVNLVGVKAITMLKYILSHALSIDLNNLPKEYQDHSYIWRPAIEDNSQNHDRDLKENLVVAIRNGCEQIVNADESQLPDVINLLEKHNLPIFKRIALHLLRTVGGKNNLNIIKANLLDSELFSNHDERHEYSLLLKEFFHTLSKQERNEILSWIEEGPKYLEESDDLKKDDKLRYLKIWQRDRLTLIQDNLPNNWQDRFQQLINEFGKKEHPDFEIYGSGIRTGPNSPLSEEELSKMSVDDLIAYFQSWIPPQDFMTASPEGLSREISGMIEQNPEKYAEEAHRFAISAPTYVNGVISGFEHALRKNKTFEWEKVLLLCEWIVNQSDEIVERFDMASEHEADPDWGWTRKSVASLFRSGLSNDEFGLRFEDRDMIWKILNPLTNDADPSIDTKETYEESSFMDPANKSINTVRGEAMHAVMQYALWIYRNKSKTLNNTEFEFSMSKDIPEAQKVLEFHLDKDNDSSLAIHSVYGQWIPHLYLLDTNWTDENIINVLPLDETRFAYYKTAWDTYLVFCEPYNNILKSLEGYYKRAIYRLGDDEKKHRHKDPERRMCDHLMTFYFRGLLDLDETGGLLGYFFSNAPDELRGYALESTGRILLERKIIQDTDEFTKRMQHLWESRFSIIKKQKSAKDFKCELGSFAWWFASGKFGVKWSLQTLIEVLLEYSNIDSIFEHQDIIVKRLAELSEDTDNVDNTLKCLEEISRMKGKGWEIYTWEDDAKVILNNALDNQDNEIQKRAKDLINYFGTLGRWTFRDILPK